MSIVWPLGQGTPSVTAIERVTGPAIAPVTVLEANQHCRIDEAHENDLIEALIGAAVDFLDGDGALGRAMITQTWAQWVAQSPGDVRLLMGPFIALTSVEYYDAAGVLQVAPLADYQVWKTGDFVTIRPIDGASWPSAQVRPDAIKITYTAGFGPAASDVPQGIRHAILLMVAHWHQNRAASTTDRLRDLPFAVNALIDRHRVGWYG